MSKTDAVDLAGLSLLTIFGYAIWPPLALLVFGLGCHAYSFVNRPSAKAGE